MMSSTSLKTHAFLFTDIEASTRLWQRFPDAMKDAIERHDAILRQAVEHAGGQVVKSTGDGLMAVFSSASDGVRACIAAQLLLQNEPWGEIGPLRVRMGMHAGEAQPRGGDYFGPPVNRTARIMGAAHGGQVLLSAFAAQLVAGQMPAGAGLRDLGEHRLKDLFQPEHIFQLVHADLPGDFPPLATLSRRPNNLPTQTSAFLGRELQMDAIRQLLDTDSVRLLTLTGPGGIGKTRLALQAAADQIDRFEDGIYFVDLSPVREPDASFQTIVRAVGLTGTSDEQPIEVLKRQLQSRHMLLLLDNFEQIIDAAGGMVELLQHCPDLKMLVTSREALRVRGEYLYPIPPLTLPNGGGKSAEIVAGYESVRLFIERARAAQPTFALSDQNAPAVAEICTRLDGLPLAIELAAARLRLFSPDELRDRLKTRLELLRGGPRDLPARQRTLRGTIEWSYELLDDEERAIFQLLSVFSPTRVDAVEEVVFRLEPLQEIDVVDRLTSLVDKSLVRSVDVGGRQRLSMLETIRDFATERLNVDSEFQAGASQAHAEYFADFAQRRNARLYGPEREGTLNELEAELGNLMAAWRYWVDACDLEQLNRLLDSLWVLHDARGWYHAAIQFTNDLLGVLSTVPEMVDRVSEEITLRISLARGLMAIRGYTAEVEETYSRALALAKESGDLPQRLPVLRSIVSFFFYRGEFDKAATVGRQLLELAEQQHDTGFQVEGHLVVGVGDSFTGDVPSGLDHLDRAIALFDPQQSSGRFHFGPNPGVTSHTSSAFLLWLTGYPDRAVARATRGLELAEQLNHPYTLAYTLFHVGFLDLWRQELELVYQRAMKALDVSQQHDYPIWKALALVLQGTAMTGLGQPEEGLSRIDQGVALYQGQTTPPTFWPLFLSLRTRACVLGSQPARGLELIDQSIAMTGEGLLYGDYSVLKGDLLLTLSDPESAEAWFHSAFDVASKQGARMSQLRAATRLARLWRETDKQADGIELLRGVYQTFTEGFDTPDLVEARAVLSSSI